MHNQQQFEVGKSIQQLKRIPKWQKLVTKISLENSPKIIRHYKYSVWKSNQESLIWFSIEYALLVQESFPATWEAAITRRLREPIAKEIVLIALAFLEIFLLISKKFDVIRIWLLSKHKEYPLIPTRNNYLKIIRTILNRAKSIQN